MSEPHPISSFEARRRLLAVARHAAGMALGVKIARPPNVPAIDGRFGGVFATLMSGAKLRGCVGTFVATDDIVTTVREMTRAALKDPRFTANPVTAEELPGLCIELSLLTTARRTDDPLSLVLGRHGIVVRRGDHRGCFLPKVATERGWSIEVFLSNCCTMKAGLSPDAWKHPKTDVLLFEADVMSEAAL